jgi:hypothetical protein
VPDDVERVAAQAPPPPTTSSPITTATIVCRLLRAGALRRTGVPFVERGPFPTERRVLPLAGSTLIAGCAKGCTYLHGPWPSLVMLSPNTAMKVTPCRWRTHPAERFVSLLG